MRCTTDLTARFALTSHHIGSLELDAFANCDAPVGSIEYWEAFEREEEIRARGEDGLLDALDFNTVTFDSVEDELSMELYAEDEAEDRRSDAGMCKCHKCGMTHEWDFEVRKLARVGSLYFCEECKPVGHKAEVLRELEERRLEKVRKARENRALKFRAALNKAKEIAPHLNWAQYDNDFRQWVY